ncbi:PaaI family thioesterase [Vineibacter terrae]|uniref:PaaI family thioesterase n=1 Tax=Vineibacter terrae TaxID=2586908 RepID=A0A5C8PAG4_9HYPH|nr:PaaI family thioesterase [Vineibacter terrae]TXL70783.1 PaaI family thioesterase [Vineibacter terrae]
MSPQAPAGGIPEGFVPFDISDDFVRLIGPLHVKLESDGPRVGMMLERRHGNPLGIAHGGCLMTLADMVMGFGCGFATRTAGVHPTITLNSDFVRGARVGNWVEGKAVITRRTPNFIFARCDLVCAGEVVLSASGVFKVPTQKPA